MLSEKPDETAVNGAVFDRESYLRNVEEFEDVEVSRLDKMYSFNLILVLL